MVLNKIDNAQKCQKTNFVVFKTDIFVDKGGFVCYNMDTILK